MFSSTLFSKSLIWSFLTFNLLLSPSSVCFILGIVFFISTCFLLFLCPFYVYHVFVEVLTEFTHSSPQFLEYHYEHCLGGGVCLFFLLFYFPIAVYIRYFVLDSVVQHSGWIIIYFTKHPRQYSNTIWHHTQLLQHYWLQSLCWTL